MSNQHTTKTLLKSTQEFYYIQKMYVKENPSVGWVLIRQNDMIN